MAAKRNAKAIATATNWKVVVDGQPTVIPNTVVVTPKPPAMGGTAGGFVFAPVPSASIDDVPIVDGDVGISWVGMNPLWGCSYSGAYGTGVIASLTVLSAVSSSPIMTGKNSSEVIGTTADGAKQVLSIKTRGEGDDFPKESGCCGECMGTATVIVNIPAPPAGTVPTPMVVSCKCKVLLERA